MRAPHTRPAVRRVVCLAAAATLTAVVAAAQEPPAPADARAQVPARRLTLQDAFAEALAGSPALGRIDDAVAAAEIGEQRAAAPYAFSIAPAFSSRTDPGGFSQRQLGLNAGRTLATGARLSFQASAMSYGAGAGSLRDTGYAFSLSQPLAGLVHPAGARADLRGARAAREATERNAALARQDLVLAVARAYCAVVRDERLVASTARSRERAVRLHEMSATRAEAGLATQLDVLRAELLAAQAEAALAAQREALEEDRDRLKTLIGRRATGEIVVDDVDALAATLPAVFEAGAAGVSATPEVGAAAAPPVEALVLTALASRLDVRSARAALAEARRASEDARWQLLPPVALDVSYAHRDIGGVDAAWLNGWRVGLSLNYGLDRATAQALVATAAMGERAAERAAREAADRAEQEVRRAHRGVARAAAAVALQQQAVSVAEKQVRLAELRYARGLSDNFDVIDAENALFQAQSALTGAVVDRLLSVLELRHAAGTLSPEHFVR